MQLASVAFVGNHLPRHCGIATFTHDLHRAIASGSPLLDTCVVAMTDANANYDYPGPVKFEIQEKIADDYSKAALFLNRGRYDVISLQHEYGIFGGEAGADILGLLAPLKMPIVTTLHTVLAEPSPAQRSVLDRIIDVSAKLVVMSDMGRQLLQAVHGVSAAKIEIIPHGIPDFPFVEPTHAKAKLGFANKSVILTFGLLAPSKGIETVIDAMPGIIASCPSAVYVVLGASHPNLVRDRGEAYRESLMRHARDLGVVDHVVFLNQFVDQATLLDHISMCDVYVTPYLNEAQMTSGTLAYSFGLGKAVVSTPYWHAQELLADGRGVLVPFGDAVATGTEILSLLTNEVRRHSMRKRAYASSRSMIWAQTAKDYLSVFGAAQAIGRHIGGLPRVASAQIGMERRRLDDVPELEMGHLLAMCDSTGLLQHAVHSVPDRSHGYCVDDNARALLLTSMLKGPDKLRLPEVLTARFAAFVQHAWNHDTQRFRNFMSYERKWLEDVGSEDSHGRTLWALAQCSIADTDPSRRSWAANLFKTALPPVERFSSPRAWAFALLAINASGNPAGLDETTKRLRELLADRLLSLLASNKQGDWHWFENVLSYDNARLPQALIVTGLATGSRAYTDAGLQSLRWLMIRQTASSGCFRPVGSESFGKVHQAPAKFDQQPVEATATIAACLAAARADSNPQWLSQAMSAFAWFFGANDLRVPLADATTGSCLDGLHADRPNANMGAESVLSYLLALEEIRAFRAAAILPVKRKDTDNALPLTA